MLRQRNWAIMIRPYYIRPMGGTSVRMDYDGVPKNGRSSNLGFTGTDTATALRGNGEGGTGGTAVMETGGWTMWYSDTSFKKVRQKYKEILDLTAKENIRVVEMLPTDTLVTPLS